MKANGSIAERQPKFLATSLLTTVVLATVIAMICSSLLLLAYINFNTVRIEHTEARLQRNLRSAVNICLADTEMICSNSPDTLDLFNQGNDSAILRKENWGLFKSSCATVISHGNAKTKCFLSGPATDTPLDACLYLAQHDIPLYVSGTTLLTGDAYLPPAGIQSAYVDQQGFASDKPLSGATKTSHSLPPVGQQLITYLRRLDSSGITTSPPDSLDQSFLDTAAIFHTRSPLYLSRGSLNGHILIISDSSISVEATVALENVLLIAPSITIEKGFSGVIQAIATDSLVLRNGCRLNYPSSLILIKAPGATFQPTLRIDDSSTLSGAVVSLAPDPTDRIMTYVETGRHTVITGYLYTAGFVALKGEVRGEVLTDYFLHRSASSVLQNFLVDATIDRTKLSAWFVGPHLFSTPHPNKIIQWLH
jgi:hypothetical protein